MNFLIIDDHNVIEEGTKKWLLKIKPNANCYFVDNLKRANAILHQHNIDLIICDLELKNDVDDGFKFMKNLLSFEPRTRAIAYTGYESYRIMKKAKSVGFSSFLNKGCTFKEFEETITNVIKNGNYESKIMKELLTKRYEFTCSIFSDSINGVSDLSEKEIELTILAQETTNKHILSRKMGVKPSTIDSHFLKITEKLNLKHRQDVAFFSKEFKFDLLKIKLK